MYQTLVIRCELQGFSRSAVLRGGSSGAGFDGRSPMQDFSGPILAGAVIFH
ncbi:hypothetical protein [Vandammella animalimorsus]|uniref:hypothetical protein n=1 Tax=Vandammella animalimorsus TaxID=2029117 RepID=UPI001552D669|nr:hypothetical protein [Vandammella animalimorsus]